MLASFQTQFDLDVLLRFPVSFDSFYLLHLIFGLVDVSTILGGFCCLGIWTGITVARPGLSAWTALALAVFAAFNILLVRAIFAWIERWLAQRKTREILTAVFLVSMLSMNFLNPAFRGKPGGPWFTAKSKDAVVRYIHVANEVQGWLPPGLAANGVKSGAEARAGGAVGSLGLLGIYALAMEACSDSGWAANTVARTWARLQRARKQRGAARSGCWMGRGRLRR